LSSFPRALKVSRLWVDSNTTVCVKLSPPGRSGTACCIIWMDDGASVILFQLAVSWGTTCFQLG